MPTHMKPSYHIPSWTQVTWWWKSATHMGKKNLCNVLWKEARFAAVTIDTWTSKAIKSFATYIANFIDDNWSLQSCVLVTQIFDVRHTAGNIKEHLCTVVKKFVPLKNISCVVNDKAANVVVVRRQLHKEINHESTVCADHMLQTCLQQRFRYSPFFFGYATLGCSNVAPCA